MVFLTVVATRTVQQGLPLAKAGEITQATGCRGATLGRLSFSKTKAWVPGTTVGALKTHRADSEPPRVALLHTLAAGGRSARWALDTFLLRTERSWASHFTLLSSASAFGR